LRTAAVAASAEEKSTKIYDVITGILLKLEHPNILRSANVHPMYFEKCNCYVF